MNGVIVLILCCMPIADVYGNLPFLGDDGTDGEISIST